MAMRSSVRGGKVKVNALIYVTQKIGPEVIPHLLQTADLNITIVSDVSRPEFTQSMAGAARLDNVRWVENVPQDPYKNQAQMVGHKIAKWADLLVVIADASMIALMLSGLASDIILHTLRCWDTSKRIVLLPEMSVAEWRHPTWERQLSKIQRRWDWVTVLSAALWDWESPTDIHDRELDLDTADDLIWTWNGPNEILEAIYSETQSVLRLSRALSYSRQLSRANQDEAAKTLPNEIWTNIMDHLGDWELATALGIYTHLPVPPQWEALIPKPNGKSLTVEYTILTMPMPQIKAFFEKQSTTQEPPRELSQLASRLVFRFALTELLTYLATHQKDIFWSSFGLALLPYNASLVYNSPTILQWWKECPTVIKKEYGPEMLDGASRAGFVDVLEWWLHSGLDMLYTDKALESASAKGHVDVLEWWRVHSQQAAGTARELPLRVGKSMLLAAQSGRTESINWWDASGIPYLHEDGVARLASTHGHVEVLERWRSLKGSKMIFDNQVLVGATKNGHANVLEWWKQASKKWQIRVEYKTCDIEEAMEDAVGGGGEGEVREWWSRNGLNLGVGTGEWMRVKTL